MNKIKEILNKYACVPYRYTIKNNVIIVDTDTGHFVFKKKDRNRNNTNSISSLYKYLKSRNFVYFPNLIEEEDEYDVYQYVEEIETPREQKALDIIYLTSLLHNKTTYYKEIDIDEYKEIYEDIIKQLEYLYNYYTDLITVIERNIYMSPAEYLIARNISKIYMSIIFCRRELEEWYELIKEKKKKRLVTVHNNLDVDHFIRGDDLYLLSWDKARVDLPIYDLYYFYKKRALEFDFEELLKLYESKYPLLEEERKLLFILLSIPDKIELNKSEYENCKEARKIIDYIYKTEMLIIPYYTPQDIK